MKTSRYTVALAAAVALCTSVIAAATAAAAEPEFQASGAGAESVKALGPQKFKTKAGVTECTAASGTGSIAAGKKTNLNIDVTYSECTAFGLEAKISIVEFEFHANGTVTILKPIVITAVSESYCKVEWPDQTVDGTVTYKNLDGALEIILKLTKIKSTGSGSSAVCDYGTEEKGTYTGKLEVKNSGGTIEYVAG